MEADVLPPFRPTITAEQVKGFSLFTLKAVLSGRATKLSISRRSISSANFVATAIPRLEGVSGPFTVMEHALFKERRSMRRASSPLLFGFENALSAGWQKRFASISFVFVGGDTQAFDSVAIQVAGIFALRDGEIFKVTFLVIRFPGVTEIAFSTGA